MPIASGPTPPDSRRSTPQQLDNRHLTVSNLSRNDSLRSERSDKRVSFNNDVGIKHIPRGASKPPAVPTVQKTSPSPDEWAGCAPVKLQPNNLTPEELEKEAAHLVHLVDSINCKASPTTPKKHQDFTSRSLDRSQNRNGAVNGINYTRITNPIIKHLKADVNRRENRRKDGLSDSESDRYREARHKSVPNLLSPNNYNSRLDNRNSPYLANSVENLVEDKHSNLGPRGRQLGHPEVSYLSADNLLEAEPRKTTNLNGYKSLGNIQYCDSDSTDLSHTYRPKVNQIIGRLNGNLPPGPKYNSDASTTDRESSPTRRPVAPTRRLRHNHNKPFSYTQPNQRTTSRNISPSRHVESDDMYAQVDKHGMRQRLSMDSDYSAKIIITEDRPKNPYEGDDEAYETYQVQNNSFRDNRYSDYGLNLSRYELDSKNNTLNNNINMSSVAVQTDMSKSRNKDRRPMKGMAPQPPVAKEPFSDSYRREKDLKSDLPSADLVRQINHGFGRFDRSPSPPLRRAFNKTNAKPVIPLLSDTSDSEPEYRKRSDPLKKIRNQVLKEGNLEEEDEEWEEREMMNDQKRNLDFHPTGMRPLTIDEVEAMSLELDQHGGRRLVVAQKTDEARSSSLQKSHKSHVYGESKGERAYSEERARASKPLREKSQSNRDVSIPREKSLDRNQKNNLEKEKLAQEKAAKLIEKETEKKQKDTLKTKNKEKKAKESKEKKKKRIKIKFFYDPRPQDKPDEDPLTNFSEYKGNDRYETEKVPSSKPPRSKSYDSRSPSRERKPGREISSDPRHLRDSSRERTLSRPGRGRQQTRPSNDHGQYRQSGSGNERSSHDESHDGRRRVRSSDSLTRRDRYDGRDPYPERGERRGRYEYDNQNDKNRSSYNREERSSDKDRENRDNYEYYDEYNGREGYRNVFLQRREAYEQLEQNNERKDFLNGRRERSPDRRSANLKKDNYRLESPDREWSRQRDLRPDDSKTKKFEDKNISSPDEDGKQERVMRQRKKFLSALMTDGRAKSSNPPSPDTKGAPVDYKASTLKRSQSSTAHAAPERPYEPEEGQSEHESDPQPPPSITSSKPKASSKKSNTKTKKKKKSWSWGFLGLRSNKRKKKGRPSSRIGSEAGGSNVGGTVTLKRTNPQHLQGSRPTSRASSHRSSTRRSKPSVRASKIRKDTGSRGWTSKTHDQRETRQWESATLQRQGRGAPRGQKDYQRTTTTPTNRGARRLSDGSSASSASPRQPKGTQVGRNPGFKQRYFGESDTEPPRHPRGSGPGDYRSLPARTSRTPNKRPTRGGSAGSSLQSSESDDSHQGSRASHVSTGSNRSVYLHATAVADIPVQKEGGDPDRPGVQRQAKKVTRSFSLLAPWKPKHPREPHQIEYDSRDTRHAKPPRPPRRAAEPVGRSHTLTNKDSKLSGWLKKKKSKEALLLLHFDQTNLCSLFSFHSSLPPVAPSECLHVSLRQREKERERKRNGKKEKVREKEVNGERERGRKRKKDNKKERNEEKE
ncbi:hypothetical protein FHG87_018067 [Trinorchestia longiramus]|nr:hypothetical protein FHG87_018067 [Trinorchestia longiramus]